MKALSILPLFFVMSIQIVFGQSDKYQKIMETNVAQFDTAKTGQSFVTLFNSFERVAMVEKNQWLPYYYASLCAAQASYRDEAKIDQWADKADAYALKVDSLQGDQSETLVVRAMAALARINVDFMSRGIYYSELAADYLQKAAKINPKNPRTSLVLAQIKINTPAQFGGDKGLGCQLIAQSLQLFKEADAAKNTLAPHWGRATADAVSKRCGTPTTK
ncbi:tetratricopeptide repeat protein [Tellurirhabdus bombi]|uniref:hypothetical protein n=1 Tax=Tellurirhabdus bombi TaxID=2907205 RepID=UPI001F3E9872|nr:hypothetical protein [Tellurirhabdus bombi]